jgi:uncharacterized coiled-coil protein SlyX
MNAPRHINGLNAAVVSGIILALAAGTAPAQQDRSGKILSDIANRVEQKLSALETKTAEQNKTRAAVNDKAKAAAHRYRNASSSFQKHEAKTEVIDYLASKNTLARGQVEATMDTVVSVVYDMETLSEQLKKARMTPAQLQEQRKRLAGVIKGVGPLLAAIEKETPGDKSKSAQLAGTKQTLIMLYQNLAAPIKGAGNVYGQVEQTVEVLHDVSAQLRIVMGVLDQQKYMLQLAAHNEVVWLALWRLQQTQLGDTKIRQMAGVYMDDVMNDAEAYGEILTDSALGESDDSEQSPSVSAAWDNIARGEVPLAN